MSCSEHPGEHDKWEGQMGCNLLLVLRIHSLYSQDIHAHKHHSSGGAPSLGHVNIQKNARYAH
jgi:hypothetical protein